MRSSSFSSSSMAVALALLLLLAVASSIPSSTSQSDDPVHVTTSSGAGDGDKLLLTMMGRFHGWMVEHGRSYATAEEKLRRFEIYRSNVEFIEEANRDGRMSYRLGETPFTDLTHDEFLAMYSNRVDPASTVEDDDDGADDEMITTHAGRVHEGGRSLAAVEEKEPRINLTALPQSVDWRARGVVTPARSQGANCSSCWAFATVATIESAYAISKGVRPPLLSEQELIDCDRYDRGCSSGWMDQALRWVKENGGLASSADYPYAEKVGQCQTAKLKTYAATIRDFAKVKALDEQALMAAVAAQPVAVTFDYSDLCFQLYIGGVYDGKCFKSGVYVGPCPTGHIHALAIVGYGTKPDGTKYWIGKNSWGPKWGDNGFVYLQKDVQSAWGLCGLAQRPSYPIV